MHWSHKDLRQVLNLVTLILYFKRQIGREISKFSFFKYNILEFYFQT